MIEDLTPQQKMQRVHLEANLLSDGSYTQGAYRDTSNDGNPYNNANYYGYND